MATKDHGANLRILSLDGGDARCLSQIEILREFMHRLEMDTGTQRRPCDYFNLIVGTGAGGVLAILLGVLGMDLEEAATTFVQLCNAVFPKEGATLDARTAGLEAAFKEVLQSRQIPLDKKMKDDGPHSAGDCKVAVTYMSASNIGQCHFIRTYTARQASHNPTVAEALRATWASPSLFTPIRIGPSLRQEQMISATQGYNNPTLECLKEALDLFGPDTYVSCLLSLGTGKPAVKSLRMGAGAGSQVDSAQYSLTTLERLALDCENTANEVQRRVGMLGIYYRFSVERGLETGFQLQTNTTNDEILGTIDYGEIAAHTSAYLLEMDVSNSLDSCLIAAERSSRVTIDQLCRSQNKGLRSSQGLPPLSSFFVMRREPMKLIVDSLLGIGSETEQRIMIVSGLGGSGKTQIALKFARDYENRFKHIFFIDASTSESIRRGLLSRFRTLGRPYQKDDVEEILEILAHPDEVVSQDWLLIYDNADDPDLDLRDFMPQCDHGSIFITTRNPGLGDLSPQCHLKLETMSDEEAVHALLTAALPSGIKPSEEDKAEAHSIVQQLGYLPVAIIQAGCYIKQQQCLYEYLNRLKANRAKLLQRPTKAQRDKLKYDHSVYSAFNVTIEALSYRARELLSILSTIHHSNFPRNLISMAAKSKFEHNYKELLDRPPEFRETVEYLNSVFCNDGSWDEEDIADLLDELQQYSLLTLVTTGSIVTLRFHPLVHSWAFDRLDEKEKAKCRAAAIRLVACGVESIQDELFDMLLPHVNSLSPHWDDLHANDQLAFTQVKVIDEDPQLLLPLVEKIYEKVKEVEGEESVRTCRIELELAGMYGETDEIEKMEKMERHVLEVRTSLLGEDHPESLEALNNLALTLVDKEEEGQEAENMLKKVVEGMKKVHGEQSWQYATALNDLSAVYWSQKRLDEEIAARSEAYNIYTKTIGRTHLWTIQTMMDLVDCYILRGKTKEADELQQEILKLTNKRVGERNNVKAETLEWMGRAYMDQGRNAEAVTVLQECLEVREKILAKIESTEAAKDDHIELLDTISWLVKAYQALGKLDEAEPLANRMLREKTELLGASDPLTLDSLSWIVLLAADRQHYEEMEVKAKELLEGRLKAGGPDDPATWTANYWVGRAYCHLQKFEESKGLLRDVYEKRKAKLGENHLDTLTALSWLGRVYTDSKDYEEANKLRVEELERRIQVQGRNNVNTAIVLEALVAIRCKLGDLDAAESYCNEALEVRRVLAGEKNLGYANARAWMAEVNFQKHKYEESVAIRREVLALRMELLEPRHRLIAFSKAKIALTLHTMGGHDAEAEQLIKEGVRTMKETCRADDILWEEVLDILKKVTGRDEVSEEGKGTGPQTETHVPQTS